MIKKISVYFLLVTTLGAALFAISCGTGFKDISTANGRKAILDQANDFLTSGNCESAIEILTPLYISAYVDYEIRMTYASAYACKGGFSFTGVMGGLISGSGDIWSALVKADFSTGSDGKLISLKKAAEIVRLTSGIDPSNQSYFSAKYRTEEANLYMVFIHATIVAVVIATPQVGNAYRDTGKKRLAITGAGASADHCAAEVALATISDSLGSISSSGTALNSIKSAITTVCGANCTGANLDPTKCDATIQLVGQGVLVAIDAQWTLGP